jgi:photosystem II stability/assembly factor-like uncharacterized protein
MDISMYSNTAGYTSGLGIGKIVGSAFTTNGINWTETTTKHLDQAFQSVGHITSTEVWQVGTWSNVKKAGITNGDGVMLSQNSGDTFTGYDWNQESLARYGSFIDNSNGWIAGGQFPESNDTKIHLSQHLSLTEDGLLEIHEVKRPGPMALNNTFAAVIASTTNGGQSWTTLYKNEGTETDGFYFNGLTFISATQGWVSGEGFNSTTGESYAFIWATTDGGKTWTQQLFVEDGSIIQIRMISDTYGWACGGASTGGRSMKGDFWVTTDGQTWTLGGSIKDSYQLNLDVVDETTSYSVGATILGVCSVYKYST